VEAPAGPHGDGERDRVPDVEGTDAGCLGDPAAQLLLRESALGAGDAKNAPALADSGNALALAAVDGSRSARCDAANAPALAGGGSRSAGSNAANAPALAAVGSRSAGSGAANGPALAGVGRRSAGSGASNAPAPAGVGSRSAASSAARASFGGGARFGGAGGNVQIGDASATGGRRARGAPATGRRGKRRGVVF
jgi:hypothetical protein